MFNILVPSSFALVAALFGTSVLGHLIITSPVPFGADTINSSPLQDAKPGTSTSDYPCKQRPGVYDITAMNYMKAGEPQLLQFKGTATHGGGTMQLAITKDFHPTADSDFKLFQTFEGNAPAASEGEPTAKNFTFVLPSGTPNGQLTFAWLWNNRIGNRELYMNCAPLTVSGGSDSSDYYDSLPNAYIINLPTSECKSPDNKDVAIPHPGQFISKGDSSNVVSATGPSCDASAAAQTKGVKGLKTDIVSNGAADTSPTKNNDSTGPAPTGAAARQTAGSASPMPTSSTAPSAQTTSPVATTSVATTQPPSSSSNEGSDSATASASSTSPLTISTASPSSAQSTLPPSSNTGATTPSGTANASSPSGTTSSSSNSGLCSDDGALVCNGPNHFGLCNSGSVVWQPVAPGTTCSNGQITKRSVLRHAHVRRHVQNVGRHE